MTFLKFIFAMFLSFLPGIIGVIVTPIDTGGNLWYNTLNNSVLTPAGWVFSAVWTILYFLLGLALFFIMQKNNINNRYNKTSSYALFVLNMVLLLYHKHIFLLMLLQNYHFHQSFLLLAL